MTVESGKLGFDLNALRVSLLLSYKELCDDLNNSISENKKIIIEAPKIKSNMDNIRFCIGVLAAAYLEGNDNFKSVGGEILLPSLNTNNDL